MNALITIYFLPFLILTISDGSNVNQLQKDPQFHDNPDAYLPPPKIIRRYGYPSESHVIESEDGYLLEVHRIPHGKIKNPSIKKKNPILMHHGILSSSNDWIVNGPQKSLGYLLADRGYDVWLGNARGNTFSRSHVTKNPDDEDFWNFSFHESGVYDLPAMIDYILEVTGSDQLIYIGHSMGTTIFYVMCSERPEYNQKIKLHIGLAPVAYLNHLTSIIRYIIPYARKIKKLSDWYTKGAFLEQDFLTRLFTKLICGREIFDMNICEQYILFGLFGKDPKQFNQSMIPAILGHAPAGTSGKTLIHFSQMYKASRFQMFDYGLAGNIRTYNSSSPPLYNLSRVVVPCAMYYGKNDIISDPRDVTALYDTIPNPLYLYEVKYDEFSHLDFLTSIDLKELVNNNVLDLINNTETPGFIQKQTKAAIAERLVWRSLGLYYDQKIPASSEMNYWLEYSSDMPLKEYLYHVSKRSKMGESKKSSREKKIRKIEESATFKSIVTTEDWSRRLKEAMNELDVAFNGNN